MGQVSFKLTRWSKLSSETKQITGVYPKAQQMAFRVFVLFCCFKLEKAGLELRKTRVSQNSEIPPASAAIKGVCYHSWLLMADE